MKKLTNGILALATIGCLVAFFNFSYVGKQEGNEAMVYTLKIGMPGSPWLIRETGGADGTQSSKVRFNSISWVFLAGAGFLVFLRRKAAQSAKD